MAKLRVTIEINNDTPFDVNPPIDETGVEVQWRQGNTLHVAEGWIVKLEMVKSSDRV